MGKKRVLLKISGESLSGEAKKGFSRDAMEFLASEIVSIKDFHQIAIVIGGGNLIRGSKLKMEIALKDTVVADYAGMLATVINAIIFQDILENNYGLKSRVMTALEIRAVGELFLRRKAISHLEQGRIVLLAGGTGNPDFSTDTAMVLRAHEVGAEIVLKGTKVDGIYDKDPKSYADAKRIEKISYMDYLNKDLRIIDATAVTLAGKHKMTIQIFNIFEKGNLGRILAGESIGSKIGDF